jgi:hypothetical protein
MVMLHVEFFAFMMRATNTLFKWLFWEGMSDVV